MENINKKFIEISINKTIEPIYICDSTIKLGESYFNLTTGKKVKLSIIKKKIVKNNSNKEVVSNYNGETNFADDSKVLFPSLKNLNVNSSNDKKKDGTISSLKFDSGTKKIGANQTTTHNVVPNNTPKPTKPTTPTSTKPVAPIRPNNPNLTQPIAPTKPTAPVKPGFVTDDFIPHAGDSNVGWSGPAVDPDGATDSPSVIIDVPNLTSLNSNSNLLVNGFEFNGDWDRDGIINKDDSDWDGAIATNSRGEYSVIDVTSHTDYSNGTTSFVSSILSGTPDSSILSGGDFDNDGILNENDDDWNGDGKIDNANSGDMKNHKGSLEFIDDKVATNLTNFQILNTPQANYTTNATKDHIFTSGLGQLILLEGKIIIFLLLLKYIMLLLKVMSITMEKLLVTELP